MKRSDFLRGLVAAPMAMVPAFLDVPWPEDGTRPWPRWMAEPANTGALYDPEWDGKWLHPGDRFSGGIVSEVDYVEQTITIDWR